ncbi:MAG: rRNA maturation RNase YbeY [Clostridia bacterium]|jgi:probable rRNA maturation factor|nr:rRNA maturation RNase YbeY [Clostridia bacterium]
MYQIEYLEIEEKKQYEEIIKKVVKQCYNEENLEKTKLYISITLTNPKNIHKINKECRNVDKETDVLSFPMFEKEEIETITQKSKIEKEDILGDIVISIEKVKEQAKEYGHSFERELAYMIVHGFYHLIGYDHIEEDEKKEMRAKEEVILNKLGIKRDEIDEE